MKRLLLAALITIGCLSAQAQKDVYLKINHLLGANTFAFNTQANNNLGNAFKVTRLQYYIAEISIVHDGGQITNVPNTWILVNTNNTTNQLLGNFNVTNLEAVKFTIGVEQSKNHLDPSQYAMSHPLAPKSPSMHWGWSAGYRFVAMEGKSGNNFSQTFQFHALGDGNYYPLTLNTVGVVSGSDLVVEINADYEKAIQNINVSTGPIIHGEGGAAADLLVNFNKEVFTSADGNATIGIVENDVVNFNVYPNPSTGNITIKLEDTKNRNVHIVVTDILGNQKEVIKEINGNKVELNLSKSGLYFISIVDNDGVFSKTEKLIIL